MHPIIKQLGFSIDLFCYCIEPLGLLLWFGDLATARIGFTKVLDAHKRILARVRQGAASAHECAPRPRSARAA